MIIFISLMWIGQNYSQESLNLTLEGAIQMAIQNNPAISHQTNAIDLFRGQYWSEVMPENPEVGYEYEEIPLGQPFTNFGEKKLFVSQSINFPTYYIYQHKFMRAQIEREMLRLEEIKRDLIFKVRQAYYFVLLQQKLLELSKKNLQLSRDYYEKTARIYELGETTRLNLLKAKVNLGTAQQKVNGQEQSLEAAFSQLRHLLGKKHYQINQLTLIDSLPEVTTWLSFDQAMPLLRNHPALLGAQMTMNAALQAKKLTWSGFLPEINLSYYRQKINKENFWGGEIGLSIPLWFAGQKGRIEQKNAEVRMAHSSLLATQLQLKNEFDQAVARFRKAFNEVALFKTGLLVEAEEAFRIARQSNKVGAIGYLEFIDSQQTLIQTKENYYQALYNYQVEKGNLLRLLGE